MTPGPLSQLPAILMFVYQDSWADLLTGGMAALCRATDITFH